MGRKRGQRLCLVASLLALIGVPYWLTYREMQHARASAALIAAIQRRDTPAALAALDAGANPNSREDEHTVSLSQVLRDWWNRLHGRKLMHSNGRTALVLAIYPYWYKESIVGWGDTRVMRALLERGADVNARTSRGETALTITSLVANDDEVVRLLVEHGANVNATNSSGDTALLYAIFAGKNGTVRLLVEHGASVNAQDNLGVTALMEAAGYGSIEKVKALLEHGADVHIKDQWGHIAMWWAIKMKRNRKIVALLKQAEARKPQRLPGVPDAEREAR